MSVDAVHSILLTQQNLNCHCHPIKNMHDITKPMNFVHVANEKNISGVFVWFAELLRLKYFLNANHLAWNSSAYNNTICVFVTSKQSVKNFNNL